MTQRPDSKQISRGFFSQRSLLAGGLSCLSGISFLGPGLVLAQTSPPAQPSSEVSTLPSAQDLLQPAEEAIAPVVEVPIESAPAPAPEIAQPEPELAPAPAQSSSEPSPETANEPLVAPDLAERAANLGGKGSDSGSAFIDSTPYDLGATTYQSPSAVVLSERSSGCEAVVNPGDSTPGSICAQPVWSGSGQSVAGSGIERSAGGYTSVSLGPVDLSSYGIGISGRSTPAGRDYYNLTARPPARLGNGNLSMLFPLSIPAAITSAFGWRIHPISGESRFHSGTDLGAPQGTPVLAAFEGEVSVADFMGGYGLTVVVQHNKGAEETLYGHLSELFVKPGEKVKQGEVIGRVGSTGFSTGPHLHFEFRQKTEDGTWITMDPGQALEYSLAKFINGVQTAQVKKVPTTLQAFDPLQRLKVIMQETVQERKAALKLLQQNQPNSAANPAVNPAVNSTGNSSASQSVTPALILPRQINLPAAPQPQDR